MKFLKAGASASEVVEVAIRSLEDKEITNAGFGSNLNMDGVVECDATIVDHLGRSGACGAVPGLSACHFYIQTDLFALSGLL
jgi:taspase (threonine aspartase 1)